MEDNNNNDQNLVKVMIDGSTFKTTLSPKFIRQKPYQVTDPNLLTAFIPGNIVDIYVKDRQKVKAGEKLLILSAMKMNNQILAPFDGIVHKVYVKKGEVVKKDHVLIELREAKLNGKN